MQNQEKDSFKELILYIKNWLNINRENQKAVKPLQIILNLLEWEEETKVTMPDTIANIYSIPPNANYSYDLESLQRYAPMQPTVDTAGIYSLVPKSTGEASALFSTLVSIEPENENEKDWFRTRKESYERLIQEIELASMVQDLIKKLDLSLSDEFELMEQNYFSNDVGFEKDVTAGFAMRNVLEHYKGKLWIKAKKANEQKFEWKKMVERLSQKPKGTPEYELLLKQESTWKELQIALSDVAKLKQIPREDINSLHIKLLTHLYIVLSYIKL